MPCAVVGVSLLWMDLGGPASASLGVVLPGLNGGPGRHSVADTADHSIPFTKLSAHAHLPAPRSLSLSARATKQSDTDENMCGSSFRGFVLDWSATHRQSLLFDLVADLADQAR